MTREQTCSEIMEIVEDFNRRGIPIYLKKLCALLPDPEYGGRVDAALPTVSKYVAELIEDGKLVESWVDNVDARGHNKELYIPEYFKEEGYTMQQQRTLVELRRIGVNIGKLADALSVRLEPERNEATKPKEVPERKMDTLDKFLIKPEERR